LPLWFDADSTLFDVDDNITLNILQDAISEIDAQYQPASDDRNPAYRQRYS